MVRCSVRVLFRLGLVRCSRTRYRAFSSRLRAMYVRLPYKEGQHITCVRVGEAKDTCARRHCKKLADSVAAEERTEEEIMWDCVLVPFETW